MTIGNPGRNQSPFHQRQQGTPAAACGANRSAGRAGADPQDHTDAGSGAPVRSVASGRRGRRPGGPGPAWARQPGAGHPNHESAAVGSRHPGVDSIPPATSSEAARPIQEHQIRPIAGDTRLEEAATGCGMALSPANTRLVTIHWQDLMLSTDCASKAGSVYFSKCPEALQV